MQWMSLWVSSKLIHIHHICISPWEKNPRNYTFTNIYITEQEQVWYYFLPNYNSTLIPTRKGMCTSSIYVYQQCWHTCLKNGKVSNLDHSLKFLHNYEVFNKLTINFHKYFWTVEYLLGLVNFCYLILQFLFLRPDSKSVHTKREST